MRKVTEQIVRAFRNGENKRIGNSETRNGMLFLHGNKIAEYRNGSLWITNAGWQSNTTKERLNALPNVRIHQKNWAWYLNGIEWGGEWVEVSTWGEWVSSAPADEVEFNTTSEWTGKYSRPLYSIFHTNTEAELERVEEMLRANDIPCRRMESDTSGEWKPNYFVVVLPADIERAKVALG